MSRSSTSHEVYKLIRAMPKIELHVHLEGSIEKSTLLSLANRNNIDLSQFESIALGKHYQLRNFRHFVSLYERILSVLRTPEDFALAIVELGRRAARQNIRYMEVTFSAETHHRLKGISFDEMFDAITYGADLVKRKVGVEMRFVIDYVRGLPAANFQQMAERCIQFRHRGIGAIGLSGYETDSSFAQYDDVIRWAIEHGLLFIPHAGEMTGSGSVWDVLHLEPFRIGHGFRAIEDPLLVDYLRYSGITLDICPTSNLRLGNVTSIKDHPIRQLWEAGVKITVNTDDPAIFGITLCDEYSLVIHQFGFTLEELARMNLHAIRSSLLPDEDRSHFEDAFQAEFKQLGLS